MNTTGETLQIDSIEQLTLFALDRSQEGLTSLQQDCRRCADLLDINAAGTTADLTQAAEHLAGFRVFEADVVTFFGIDSAVIADPRGSLQDAERQYGEALDRLLALLGAGEFIRLADLLRNDLPAILARFQELLPRVRDYVDVQYIENGNAV